MERAWCLPVSGLYRGIVRAIVVPEFQEVLVFVTMRTRTRSDVVLSRAAEVRYSSILAILSCICPLDMVDLQSIKHGGLSILSRPRSLGGLFYIGVFLVILLEHLTSWTWECLLHLRRSYCKSLRPRGTFWVYLPQDAEHILLLRVSCLFLLLVFLSQSLIRTNKFDWVHPQEFCLYFALYQYCYEFYEYILFIDRSSIQWVLCRSVQYY